MAKRARKQNPRGSFNDMVIELQDYRRKKLQILPRNLHQEDFLDSLTDASKHIVFATGPAGTGKTMMAVQSGVQKLEAGEVDRIVITRPAVSVDEQHGFLPGDLKQKMEPWTRPIFDFLEEYYKPKQVVQMIENKTIEISPLAYMRGRTLNNAFMILDEAQNATSVQMKMFLTRLGVNSKAIITGDVTQTDLSNKLESGLVQVLSLLKDVDGIGFCELSAKDIVRHKLVKDIIKAYNEGKN